MKRIQIEDEKQVRLLYQRGLWVVDFSREWAVIKYMLDII